MTAAIVTVASLPWRRSLAALVTSPENPRAKQRKPRRPLRAAKLQCSVCPATVLFRNHFGMVGLSWRVVNGNATVVATVFRIKMEKKSSFKLQTFSQTVPHINTLTLGQHLYQAFKVLNFAAALDRRYTDHSTTPRNTSAAAPQITLVGTLGSRVTYSESLCSRTGGFAASFEGTSFVITGDAV